MTGTPVGRNPPTPATRKDLDNLVKAVGQSLAETEKAAQVLAEKAVDARIGELAPAAAELAKNSAREATDRIESLLRALDDFQHSAPEARPSSINRNPILRSDSRSRLFTDLKAVLRDEDTGDKSSPLSWVAD
jgi:hypothetical protein